jgi:NADH-quinone oxidoreductase subunit F
MCCLGRCHENAAFSYDGKNYSAKSEADLEALFENSTTLSEDEYQVESSYQPAILTPAEQDLKDFYAVLKKALSKDSADVLEEIKKANLRGRGGAGFPMGQKLGFCRNAESDQKYIVCNADEGDPGAYSDRYLLEKQPHLVLFGMIVAGYAIGADTGVLYIRAEYPESITIVHQAIEDLQKHQFIGEDIFGSGFSFKFKVIKAAGAYICGEETALLSSIEGQRPEVRIRPPFPAIQGLFNKPTVVNNVETFASLHYIMQNGGEAYGEIGTEKSKGTKLVSLDSLFNKPGIYEVEMGTPLSDVFDKLGGGFKEPVKAVQIGGPLGGIVPSSMFSKLSIDFESFQTAGFLLGHASVVSIPESFPMMAYLEHLFEFAADESCGKCFPCRLGSTRGHELIEKALHDNQKIDRTLFDDLMETLEIGSLCALGGLIPLPAKNALEHFPEELKTYFK